MNTANKRPSGTSLYYLLYMALQDQITRGVYEPGSLIPTEEELCREYDVSRITVRRAVSDLEAKGYLRKHPGRGTFVAENPPTARISATLGFLEMLHKNVEHTKVEILSLAIETPPRDIALQLELEDGARALREVRLRRSRTVPVLLAESWVYEALGKEITRAELRKKALYEVLMSHGVDFGRVVQEVSAVAAGPATAKLLDVEAGVPMVKLTRLLYDTRRRPVQHLTVFLPPERSRLLMEVSIDALETFEAGRFFHDASE